MRNKRLYRADDMRTGIQQVSQLQAAVLKEEPAMAGPLKRLKESRRADAAEQVEQLEGHCLTCKGKKTFTVEKTDTMKNGALRKSGKGECGHTISHFVSGAADSGT